MENNITGKESLFEKLGIFNILITSILIIIGIAVFYIFQRFESLKKQIDIIDKTPSDDSQILHLVDKKLEMFKRNIQMPQSSFYQQFAHSNQYPYQNQSQYQQQQYTNQQYPYQYNNQSYSNNPDYQNHQATNHSQQPQSAQQHKNSKK